MDRTITITGVPCGIPAGTIAVSANLTIFNITGASGNGVVKVGTAAAPTTAWINYPATETQRANAGALPLSGAGAIVVQVAQGGGTADIIVDVNGYYNGDVGPRCRLGTFSESAATSLAGACSTDRTSRPRP